MNVDKSGSGTSAAKTFGESAREPVALSLANLALLPPDFEVPRYDPAKVSCGILHIGPSNFSRAHIAKMAHDVLNAAADKGEDLDFGLKAVSLKSADAKHSLLPQDNLYTLTSKGTGRAPRHEVIGSIRDVICARDDAGKIIEAAADPSIKIITMTVTQNGYHASENTSDSRKILDTSNPEFSTIRLLVHSLNMRRQKSGATPPVILSLDNMDGNGRVLETAVLHEARLVDGDLADWISHNVPFPCTMVDRITPSKSQAHVDEIKGLGVKDNTPVLAEPMPHVPLVIEDLSANPGMKGDVFRNSGIMKLADAGASFSPHVARYESMKLRMLNGAHMALGCVGTLCGYKTSDEAMKDPLVRTFVEKFMDQVIDTLTPIPGINYQKYKAELISRLDNPYICDPLIRLARNGISKACDRLHNTVRDAIAFRTPHDCITFTSAAWLHYAGRLDAEGYLATLPRAEQKEPNEKDTLTAKYTHTNFIQDVKDHRYTIDGIFTEGREKIWGPDLMSNSRFIGAVKSQFELIDNRGIQASLKLLTGMQGHKGPEPGQHIH